MSETDSTNPEGFDETSWVATTGRAFATNVHRAPDLVDLTISQQMTIVLTATLASIGSAAVPSAGLVMMIVVLQSVGLNPAWIAIIFPVDRILDMMRTVVNVTGDATVSTIIAKSPYILAPLAPANSFEGNQGVWGAGYAR